MRPPSDSRHCEPWLREALSALKRSTQNRMREHDERLRAHHDQLLAAACAGDQAMCRRIIDETRQRQQPEPPNIVELVLPLVYRIETDWLHDRRSFSDTLFAFWNLQQLLQHHHDRQHTRLDPFDNIHHRRSMLLSPAPGCQHSIGTLAVADFFRSHGWKTTALTDSTHRAIVNTLSSSEYDFLGLSVGHDEGLDGLADFLYEVRACSRNAALRILVGGNIFTLSKSEYSWIGADFLATSPMDALAYCMASFQSHPH